MLLQSRLKSIAEAFAGLRVPVYHYFAPAQQKVPYVVWNEDSEDNSFEADNKKARQGLFGYIEYYTQKEFDSMADEIQEKLESIEGLSWTLENVIYGDPASDDNNIIHYTWSWRAR